MTQVFFSDDLRKSNWKVILKKKNMIQERSVKYIKFFITTTMEVGGLIAQTRLLTTPNTTSLIGAIELSKKDNI